MSRSEQIYLNLTNGLEAISDPQWGLSPDAFRVVRIQSTALEQSRWGFVIMELDYGFLMDLALGVHVMVIDYSARKPESRSLFQGIPFIKYVLTRYWLGRDEIPMVKKHNVHFLFNQVYQELPPAVFTKLRYFRQFLHTEEIRLTGVNGGRSTIEGCRKILDSITSI